MANMANFDDYLRLCEAMPFENMTHAKERQQSLSRAIKLQTFDYLQSNIVEVFYIYILLIVIGLQRLEVCE